MVTDTIASVDALGTTITMTSLSQPANYFLDGLFTFNQQTRKIVKHLGNVIKITYPFNSIPAGTANLFPGCDLTEATCGTKFSNLVNHGGFRRLPAITPYDSKGIL
jgi:hypothetical protein